MTGTATSHAAADAFQLGFHRGGIGTRFFVADVNPLQPSIATDGVVDGIEAVSGDRVNPFHSHFHEYGD